MTRRLKRVLQDEHNDLLDRLRNVEGAPTLADVLAPAEAQAERYLAAARPFMVEAAVAGARFVKGSEAEDSAGGDAEMISTVADAAVRDAVVAIVEPLRNRIEAVLEERGRDANDVLVDALASVYRQTRSHRVEPLVADFLSAAHAMAIWHAAPDGAALRWIAEDAGGPCPDCDDNALAGPVRKGEPFPTGQLYPRPIAVAVACSCPPHPERRRTGLGPGLSDDGRHAPVGSGSACVPPPICRVRCRGTSRRLRIGVLIAVVVVILLLTTVHDHGRASIPATSGSRRSASRRCSGACS